MEASNSAFSDNTDSTVLGDAGQIHAASASLIVVNQSVLPGGWSGPGGAGIIDADPMFADPLGPDGVPGTLDDDLRLQRGSPSIDTGDSAAVPANVATDLDGHARILCAAVDVGAYETGIGDDDCNGSIDLFDSAAFQLCYEPLVQNSLTSAPSHCTAFDFDANDQVNLADYVAFAGILHGPE